MKTSVHNTDGLVIYILFFKIKTMLMKINIVIIVYRFLINGLNFIQESHWAFKNISTKMLISREMKISILTWFLSEKKPTYPDQNYCKIEILQAT